MKTSAVNLLYNMASAVMVKEASMKEASLALLPFAPGVALLSLMDTLRESQRLDAMEAIEKDPSRQGMIRALSPYGVRAAIPHETMAAIMRERPSHPLLRGLGGPMLLGPMALGGLAGAGVGTLMGGSEAPFIGGLLGATAGSIPGALALDWWPAHLNKQLLESAAQKGQANWAPWNLDRLRPKVTGLDQGPVGVEGVPGV